GTVPALPPPLAGEGGDGEATSTEQAASPSPALQPKSDLSDFGRSTVPKSGRPDSGARAGERAQEPHALDRFQSRRIYRRMSDLFSPIRLGPYDLRNRLVMAPMTRNRAGPGEVPTALMATYYAQRASAGLIVTEGTQISAQGQGYPGTP